MKFSVLDKQTIQCIMTEAEFAGYGMDKKALFQNDSRVQEFFHKIMQQAEKKIGFRKTAGSVAVHASFLSDESLAITFSVGNRQKHPVSEEAAGGKQDCAAASQKASGHKRIDKAAEGNTPQQNDTASQEIEDIAGNISQVILKSKSLWNIIRFCGQSAYLPQSDLYQYRDVYFLIADIHSYGAYETAVLFILADEYLDGVCYTPSIAAFIKEHGRCMAAGHAMEVLGKRLSQKTIGRRQDHLKTKTRS